MNADRELAILCRTIRRGLIGALIGLLVAHALFLATDIAFGASYRTANFIVTADTDDLAQAIGDCAEKARRDEAIRWLGTELPKWAAPCPITVQCGPQLGAGGATSFVFDHGEVFNWQMSVQGTRQRLLDSVIPHEVCHTIFASHFRQPMPRWADEGACSTIEHPSERNKLRQMLISYLKEDRGIAFSRMFMMKEYPQDVMPLYAQGYSLCCFLMEHDGRATFIRFVADGLQKSQWNAPLSLHYGYDDLVALQQSWLSWVKAGSPVQHFAAMPNKKWDSQRNQWVPCHTDEDKAQPSGPPPDPDPAPPAQPVAPLVTAPAKADVASEPANSGPKVVHLTEAQLFELVERMAKERAGKKSICDEKSCQPCREDADGGSNVLPTGRGSESISAGWLDSLGVRVTPIVIAGAGALGVSPPLAAVVWWLARRGIKRGAEQVIRDVERHDPRIHIVRGPNTRGPVIVDERHHNHYQDVPKNETDRAWAEAHRVVVDHFPGARRALEMAENVKDQILRGEPANPTVRS